MILGDLSNSFLNYISSSVFIDILRNPLYISILITIVIMLTIMFIYEHDRKIKTGVYVLLINLFFLFIHNNLISSDDRFGKAEEIIYGGMDSGFDDEKAVNADLSNIDDSLDDLL